MGGKELDDGDWLLYSYATLGYEWEWGDVLLSELQSFVGKFGLKIERDLYSTDKKVRDFVRN